MKTHSAELKQSLSNEAQLLLSCSRVELSDSDKRQILDRLNVPLNWGILNELASRNSLQPLLYKHLSSIGTNHLPRDVFGLLWSQYESNRRNNDGMAKELIRILGLFEDAGLMAVSFKGPVLTVQLYRDLGLREFGDLDILLAKSDAFEARRLLIENGYCPTVPLSADVEAKLFDGMIEKHFNLYHSMTNRVVEIHWRIDLEFAVENPSDERWWQSLNTSDIEGRTIRNLCAEDLLLILSVHASRHCWGSLGWIVDIAELIRQTSELDWNRVWNRAVQLKCLKRLIVSVWLAHVLLDAPIPSNIQSRIDENHDRLSGIARNVLNRMLDPNSEEWSQLDRHHMQWKLCETVQQKWHQIQNLVMEPSSVELSWIGLPRGFRFLYLPIRIGRLIKKHSWSLIKRLMRLR